MHWFDVLVPGPAMCGITGRRVNHTAEDIARLLAGSRQPVPSFDCHEPTERQQTGWLELRQNAVCGALQGRWTEVAPDFTAALARGQYFGRSVDIVNGAIDHVGWSGTNSITGSGGNTPPHFIDVAAFASVQEWRETLYRVVKHIEFGDAQRSLALAGKPTPELTMWLQ